MSSRAPLVPASRGRMVVLATRNVVASPTDHWSTSSGVVSPAASESSISSLIPIVAPSYAYSSPAPGTISFFESMAAHDGEQDVDEHGSARKKVRKKRAGWGPYQSVLKERSVDFNLTLDIQNLKQEIQTMEMLRNILASKTMIQRHDPEGSLVRKAKEHYRVLRSGFNLSETGRKRAVKEQDQKEFIKSIFDPDVDHGNGTFGIHVLIEQIKLYSVFINFISITMTGFEVITAEDSVLVATSGIMHFQITRTTIASMFPHVMGEEWLVSKLVGQEIRAETTMDFYFNTHGKVNKFQVNLDYVKTFIDILKDPREVAILLGQALITDNCMIGLTNDDLPLARSPPVDVTSEESDAAVRVQDTGFEAVDSGGDSPVAAADDDAALPAAAVVSQPPSSSSDEVSPPVHVRQSAIREPSNKTKQNKTNKKAKASSPLSSPVATSTAATSTTTMQERNDTARSQLLGPLTPTEHFSRVVKQYFEVFKTGSDSAASVSDAQHGFLLQHFAPKVGYGSVVGHQVLEDRWRSLCWCFGALSFRQLSQKPLAHAPVENLYLIQSAAEYSMRITVRTVEQVFPHLFTDLALMDILVGSTLCVQAQLTFWLEKDTGLVTSITEQMDFDGALRRVVSNSDDLAFVLTRALPTLYGFVGEVVEPSAADSTAPGLATTVLSVNGAASASDDGSIARRHAVPTSPVSPSFSESIMGKSAPSSKTKMRLANILD